MDSIHIDGGKALSGEVTIQGSKNGVLPILAATVLVHGTTVLHNCPNITDIDAMLKLLERIGCRTERKEDIIHIDASEVQYTVCPNEQVEAMRSSVMLLGPMLGRCGEIQMHYPGGCVIGKRPVDIHICALSDMNVNFDNDEESIRARTTGLEGASISLPFPSVGVTENVIMAAVFAKGVTVLRNAAREPEIRELCTFLKRAGARIEGEGSSTIFIKGVKSLREISYRIMPDRIVAGTYLFAGMITHGQIVLKDAPVSQMNSVVCLLRRMGAGIWQDNEIICMDASMGVKAVPYIRTEVYPGFPTDLQSMAVAALTVSDGVSVIEERIFENRFRIVEPLEKMGAMMAIRDNRIYISGVHDLKAAEVEAAELRGGAALVLAALSAKGTTIIHNRHYIERGYEDICRDLKLLSAEIQLG